MRYIIQYFIDLIKRKVLMDEENKTMSQCYFGNYVL